MQVREVLERMLDILSEKEWIKGHLYKIGGGFYDGIGVPIGEIEGVCLEGACNLVMMNGFRFPLCIEDYNQLRVEVSHVFMNAAAESCPEKYNDYMKVMFQFNDFEPVTREDVILAVKTAISKLEES